MKEVILAMVIISLLGCEMGNVIISATKENGCSRDEVFYEFGYDIFRSYGFCSKQIFKVGDTVTYVRYGSKCTD
jgi:hypothetical protein